MSEPQILYITTPETLDALSMAKLVEGARHYRGAIVAVPADGVRLQIINLETGEELPEASPEHRAELERLLVVLNPYPTVAEANEAFAEYVKVRDQVDEGQ